MMKCGGMPKLITNNEIVVDSSAFEHTMGDPTLLSDLQKVTNIQFELPNGMGIARQKRGRLSLMIGSEQLTLSSVYCIPGIKLNTLTCPSWDEQGVATTIRNGPCFLTDRRDGMAFANVAKWSSDGFLERTISPYSKQRADDNACRNNKEQKYNMRIASIGTAERSWHDRLGHVSMSVINAMVKGKRFGMLPSGVPEIQDCLSYTQAKHSRNSCERNLVEKLETVTIHADICGAMKTTFCSGNKYLLATTTEEQQYVRVTFLKNRSSIKS